MWIPVILMGVMKVLLTTNADSIIINNLTFWLKRCTIHRGVQDSVSVNSICFWGISFLTIDIAQNGRQQFSSKNICVKQLHPTWTQHQFQETARHVTVTFTITFGTNSYCLDFTAANTTLVTVQVCYKLQSCVADFRMVSTLLSLLSVILVGKVLQKIKFAIRWFRYFFYF